MGMARTPQNIVIMCVRARARSYVLLYQQRTLGDEEIAR